MRPEGPWQRRLFTYMTLSMIDPSRAPLFPYLHRPPNKGKEKRKKRQRRLYIWRTRPALFPLIARASFPAPPHIPLLQKLPLSADAPCPGIFQENQNSRLTKGALGCFHQCTFPMSFHNLKI